MMKKINLKYTILTILLLVFVLGGVGKVAEARIWWTQGGGQNWTKIVTSADGTKLYAYLGSGSNEYIYTSTSSGMTWSPVTSLGMNKWIGIAMSSDGTKVVAAGNTSSYIYTSTSSGVTWATSTSAIGAKDWNCVGMSKSGSNIIAINNAGAFNNVAYVSTTTGNRWASSSLTGVNHYSCAVSSDGLGFFVTLMNTDFSNTLLSYSTFANISYSNNVLTGGTWSTDLTGIGGKIYITKGSVLYGSANNGLTWSTSTISSVTDYNTLSGSLDGIHLYAAGINGLYSSHDGGVNWILDSWFNQSQNMGSTRVSVVTSDDGSKVYSGLSVGSMSLALPVLSSPGTLISTSSTSISWTTDETSTSTISYGLAANVYTGILHYDPVMYDNFGTTTHSFNVTNLLPCTTYNYMYSATDKFWNTSSSPNYSFKTSGCIANTTYIQSTSTAISNLGTLSLGNLHLTIPTGFSATTTTAQFEATELATTTVISTLGKPARYNLFNSLYQLQAMPTATSTLTTFTNPLFITLTYNPATLGVTDPSTLTIFSTDGSVWSPLSSCVVDTGLHTVTCPTTHFSTFGIFGLTIPSVITNTAVSLSGLQATISWNTDKGATTGLNYGTDSSVTTSTTTDASFASTSHYVILPNLSYSTTYYYQIVSTDIDSNTSTTSVMSFTTSADPSIVVSSGGGGGGYYPPAMLNTLLASGTTPNNIGCASGNLFSTVTGQACGITTSSTKYNFTKDLRLGMRNSDVLQLQKFLNNNGFAIAKTGVGSKGKETTYFGPATKAALVRFQKANKVPGTGFFGKMTRNVMKTKINQ